MIKGLVSVVVTTRNEELVIERLLESILEQSYKKIELILVDNNSSDNTKRIAKKFTKFVFNKGPERSAQRNFGALKSKGEYLMFLDADMALTRKVIEECVKKVTNKGGMVVIPEESVSTNYWEKVKSFERSFYLAGDNNIEAARFFLKKDFQKANGYDEKITGPEDWDLPERLQKSGTVQKRIKAHIYHHERVSSPLSLAKKKYYYGLKASRYLKQNKVPLISAKTIYLLRPVFYKQWRRLISNPLLSLSMIIMLTMEQFGGGLGVIVGNITKK